MAAERNPRGIKVKSKWSYIALGAGILVAGLTIGLGSVYLVETATHHESSHSSPDVLATPVDIRQVVTPDDKMNAFLARSHVTTESDRAAFRDLAHKECAFTDDSPWANLTDRAVLLHEALPKNFNDSSSALAFLYEAIRDYCPVHANMIPK